MRHFSLVALSLSKGALDHHTLRTVENDGRDKTRSHPILTNV
jgi:hypothetical protein